MHVLLGDEGWKTRNDPMTGFVDNVYCEDGHSSEWLMD